MWIVVLITIVAFVVIGLKFLKIKNNKSPSSGVYTRASLERLSRSELEAIKNELMSAMLFLAYDSDSKEIPAVVLKYGGTFDEANRLLTLVNQVINSRK